MLPLLAAATAGYLFLRRKRNPKARRPHRRQRVKRNPGPAPRLNWVWDGSSTISAKDPRTGRFWYAHVEQLGPPGAGRTLRAQHLSVHNVHVAGEPTDRDRDAARRDAQRFLEQRVKRNPGKNGFNQCFKAACRLAKKPGAQLWQVAGYLGDTQRADSRWKKLDPRDWIHYVAVHDNVVHDPTAAQFGPDSKTKYPVNDLRKRWRSVYENVYVPGKRQANPPYRYLGKTCVSPTSGLTYKVRYDTDYQEWQVAAFRDGKFQEGPTHYADGKEDALEVLAAFAKGADLPSKANPRGGKHQITKKEWYARGAWSNAALFRKQRKNGAWAYYTTNPKRRRK